MAATIRTVMTLSRRAWYRASLVFGVAALFICGWGFVTEGSADRAPIDPLIYLIIPAAIFTVGALSLGRRKRLLLAAVAFLDLEAALLGFSPTIVLPFVVSVPLVSLAVSARLTSSARLPVPYLVAWASSTAGVSIAVLRFASSVASPSMVVIPLFAGADAVAILMLYRLDRARTAATRAVELADRRVLDLLNGVDMIGVHVGPDSRVDFINDYALTLTGWTRAEVIGQDWYETFATPERRDAARARFEALVAGGDPLGRMRESTILTKSGDVRLIRWNHVLRHDESGRFAGLASLGEDITASRAAAEERRRYEDLVATMIQNSPLAAAVLGLDRTVQLWNPAAGDLLGWAAEEVVGRPLPPVFLGPDRWALGRMFVEAAQGRAPEHRQVQLDTRDGRMVLVRFFLGTIRDANGDPIAVSVLAEDVTALHAMEERLREAERMESIGRLAGGVAHDFNNSLTAIGGFASLISTTTREEDTRSAAATIMVASRRAAELTRELLTYSRRAPLKPQVIDVNELLVSIHPVLASLVEPRVSLAFEARAPKAFVRADPGGLERAIVNLATNARDAMPDGGIVRVSTDQQDGEVTIAVTDTGTGIPLEVQPMVFEPFYTTKAVGSGTGLGLAMVKGFVLQSGGRVNLTSVPNSGTTITIALPAAPAAELPAVALPQSPRGGVETILAVEDDAAVAAVAFRILSMNGYRVLLADCGEAALGLLRSHEEPIDLLLLDVMLPDTRGPKLAAEASGIHPEAALIYVSGYSAEELARSGELPADIELIEKPYEPAELLIRVRRLLDERGSHTAPSAR